MHADEVISGSGTSVVQPIIGTPVTSALSVRINEVMWMGTDKSTADEWVELTAVPALTGSVITQSLSLGGWTLNIRKDTGESVIAQFGSGHVIQSGSYIVVSHYNASQSRLKQEPILMSALTLPNTKLQIVLRDPSGTAIDTVDDYIGVPFAGTNPSGGGTKTSMERLSPRLSGTSIGSWRTATTARGWDNGSPIFGTPGYENGSVDPIDTVSPPDVQDFRAFSIGNTIIGLWTPDSFGNVERQVIDVLGESGVWLGTHELVASQPNWSATYSGATLLKLQTFDSAGNFSTGVIISVQPLNKPIINELMPDPPGSDSREWIELHNPYESDLDMRGWVLKSSSKSHVMPHNSGSILQPHTYLLLDNQQTGLGLANAGGEVTLSIGGMVVDKFRYESMPDGISAASADDNVRPQCLPTPLAVNSFQSTLFVIDGLQPGEVQPSTLNLNAKAISGSLTGATCKWDFGDGFVSDSCNPASHAMKADGDTLITVEITDYCGNTMIQTASIFVEGKTKTISQKKEEQCKPSVFSGVLISEFMAAPESGEEWIELHNVSGIPLSLCGWSLDDREGGSSPYSLEKESLDANGYLALSGDVTDITLNNDQDMVRLIAPLLEGGTGVVISVPYQSAEEGIAVGLREDGEWLKTPYVTPGSSNAFIEPSFSLQSATIIIESAFPDPHGPDTANEWVELRNMTHKPQWIDKWRIETGSGKSMELPKMVFKKNEVKKIRLPSSFSLKNTHTAISLIDSVGNIQSVLAWTKAEAGHPTRRAELPESFEVDELSPVSPVEMIARFNIQHSSMNVQLAGLSVPTSDDFIFINNENKNTISALIKNKIVELQSDSNNPVFYISADGVDIAPVLLRAGMAYVTNEYDFVRKEEYKIHEFIARKQKLGIWRNEDLAIAADAERVARMFDAQVAREGLIINADKTETLITPGSIIQFTTSVPADLFIAYGTGSFIPFAGSAMINSDKVIRVKALYKMAYERQKTEFSTVATHEYTVVKETYDPCLRISEIYPSPKTGENEWVEIENHCGNTVNLRGWLIDDEEYGGSKPFIFPRSIQIGSLKKYVLSGVLLGGIAFNNGGDSVVIRTPRETLSHMVKYPSIKKGRSYANSINGFCLTDAITPMIQNICQIHSSPKKQAKAFEVIIGLRNLHTFLVSQNLLKNTKIDQSFSYFEGLNLINIDIKIIMYWICKYTIFVLIVFLIWRLLLWWKNSVE